MNMSTTYTLETNFIWKILIFFFFTFYIFGIIGVIYTNKNLLITLLYIEISYLGIISFLLISGCLGQMTISIFYAIFILLIAAAESVIGLGILIFIFTIQKKISYMHLIKLRG
jgi:NADH-ubiquinone oxidoreductase chain 4L